MSTVNTIITLSHLPILVAALSAAWLYRSMGRSLRAFSWFLFLSGAVQFASLALCYARHNNMPLLHFYVAAGGLLLIRFYKTLLRGFISPRIMWGIGVVFLLLTVANSAFLQPVFRFNSNALALESIIVIILALFTFIFFLNDTMKQTGVPDRRSLTWINSGLFIYYLSCLLLFYFGDTILFRLSRDLSRFTWVFHAFFSTVMYTCFIIGLWMRSSTRSS